MFSLVPKLTKTGCLLGSISSIKAQSMEGEIGEVVCTGTDLSNMSWADQQYLYGNGGYESYDNGQGSGSGTPTPPTIPPPTPPKNGCGDPIISDEISNLLQTQDLDRPIDDLKKDMLTNPNENGFTFGFGNSGFIINNQISGATPSFSILNYAMSTEGSIHVHPNNGTFSPQDFKTLIETNRWNNGNMTDSYILCPDGNVYDLHIDDSDKAYRFYDNFQWWVNPDHSFSSSTNFGRDFLDEQAYFADVEGMDPFHTNKEIEGGYAWAYVLNKYDTGASIWKMKSDESFDKLSVDAVLDDQGNPTGKFSHSECNN